jgi:hypothetical protein
MVHFTKGMCDRHVLAKHGEKMHKKGYEWIKAISTAIAAEGKKRKPNQKSSAKGNNSSEESSSSSTNSSSSPEEPSPKTHKKRRWSPGVVPKPPQEYHRSSPTTAQLSLLTFAERPNFSATGDVSKSIYERLVSFQIDI